MRPITPTFAGALLALTCLSFPALGAEAPLFIQTPPVATCVSRDELAMALERAGIPVATGAPTPGAVELRISGPPKGLVVAMKRGDAATVEHLSPATCETATDVVLAFVTSTLAPAPVVPAAPKRRVDDRALKKALGDELARRGVQLAVVGVRLTLSEDADDGFVALLARKQAPKCDREVPLGKDVSMTPEGIRIAADAIERGLATQNACAASAAEAAATAKAEREKEKRPPPVILGAEPQRHRALRNALHEVDKAADYRIAAGAFEAVGGALLFALLGAGEAGEDWQIGFSRPASGLLTTSAAIFSVGGGATLFAPEDYRRATATATLYAGAGFLHAGGFWSYQVPRRIVVGPLVGSLMTTELVLANAALRRPPVSRLRRARHEVAVAAPSPKRAQAIERDLRSLEGPIPTWVVYLPLLVGGVMALVPPLGGETQPEDDEAVFTSLSGLQFVAHGLTVPFTSTIFDGYTSELRKAGLEELSFGPGPGDRGGLSLSGRF